MRRLARERGRESSVYRSQVQVLLAGNSGEALVDIRAQTALNHADGKEEGLVDDLDGEPAVGVLVAGCDALFAERSGGACELYAVLAQALGGGGELRVGEGNFDHGSECTRAAAGCGCRPVMQRRKDGILGLS